MDICDFFIYYEHNFTAKSLIVTLSYYVCAIYPFSYRIRAFNLGSADGFSVKEVV